jgi:hypothetical protein
MKQIDFTKHQQIYKIDKDSYTAIIDFVADRYTISIRDKIIFSGHLQEYENFDENMLEFIQHLIFINM